MFLILNCVVTPMGHRNSSSWNICAAISGMNYEYILFHELIPVIETRQCNWACICKRSKHNVCIYRNLKANECSYVYIEVKATIL